MDIQKFKEIVDSAGITYLLFVITFLLMYIAFWKKDTPRKSR